MQKPSRRAPLLFLFLITAFCACNDPKKKTDEKGKGDAGDSDTNVDGGVTPDTEAVQMEQQVETILSGLTLEQKAAQMSQPQYEDAPANELRVSCYGSVFNGGEEPINPNTPGNWAIAMDALQSAAVEGCGIPILYGIDAVHGNAKISGSTVFPHNIGLGATQDADLVERIGMVTGQECRGVGIHLSFAPAISVVRDERWGRTYEGFGETPEINAELGGAFIKGLQGGGDFKDPGSVAATAKHYVGDGGTTDGQNNGVDRFGEATMRAIHLPPYASAIDNEVAVVMPSYHTWERNGQIYSMSQDAFTLTGMLVDELGFDGIRLSDYDAVARIDGMFEPYTLENVKAAVNAGMDMAMIAMNESDPSHHNGIAGWTGAIIEGVNTGLIAPERVDDAVRRILRIKLRMDLFANNFAKAYSNPTFLSQIWSAEHQALAREAVQKSLVLLKNDNGALPLDKTAPVTLAGPWADNIGVQAGGWTISWQGTDTYTANDVKGETIRDGMAQVGGAVTWNENGDSVGTGAKVVVVVGEHPYAEGWGDHLSEENSGSDPVPSVLLKDQEHYSVLESVMNGSDAQIVLVILSGRPLIIDEAVLTRCDAIVAAWLPGSKGIGVADVLFGDAGFTGKLPHTWPRDFSQIPVNVNKQADEPGYDAATTTVLYPYGYGLTY